jgi:hypothetical protein
MTKFRDTITGRISSTKVCLDGTFLVKINNKWYTADSDIDQSQISMYSEFEVNDKSCIQYCDEFPTVKPI